LCAADKNILIKSRDALRDEIERCSCLGIPYINFHPGAHKGRGIQEGVHLVAESLNLIHEQTKSSYVTTVLETTAGQGTSLGHSFEELRLIIDLTEQKNRMGVCIDTCHIFAAGYDISTEKGWEHTLQEFDNIIGLNRLVAIHVNDSKRELGSRVDRHEHIGQGQIGIEGFRFLMNYEIFDVIPKILETPKGIDMIEDIENMRTLKSLIRLF